MCASSARRAAVALALLLVAGCSSGSPAAAPDPSPTPMAELDAASVELPRIAFCSLVPRPEVAAALDGPAQDASSWGNGDRLDLRSPGSRDGGAAGDRDVVQEVGCAWMRGPVAARAWVFARPVSPALARGVVRQSARERGCETSEGPGFGSPSLRQVCRTGDQQRVRHAGLFGQTWLTCEVTAPLTEQDVGARTERWCVTLVGSLDTAS